ncbi:hypothetical protein ACFQX6_59190 [Streptosporangium lutulentum]
MIRPPHRRRRPSRLASPSWYATRRRRRILACAGAGSTGMLWIGAIVCFYLAPSLTAMWITFALVGAFVVLYVVFFSALVGADRGMVGFLERSPDERQARERQKIQADAHRGTLWVLVAVFVLVMSSVGRDSNTVLIPTAAIAVFLVALILTHLIMPSLVAAWRMPDPLPDDED